MKEASILVGGEAGEGIRAAGKIIGRLFNELGYYVFIRDDYPSLIEGGHNFAEIRISSEMVSNQYREIDLLAAFDEKTIEKHLDDLKKDGMIITNSDKLEKDSANIVSLPITTWRKEVEGPEIIENTGFVAAIASLFDVPLKVFNEVLKEQYGEKAGINIEIAKKAFVECNKSCEKIYSFDKSDREKLPLLTGNQSMLLGASAAGLDTYIGYPMTPATSILHFGAENKRKLGLEVIQPENEIAVVNIGLGASFAGAKTMVGTSGGGYDLMQEAISLAGMSETPIVLIEAQRAGPSTGVPTYTSQSDLKYVLSSGHGEFPHIVIAPGDIEECFKYTARALNLAWKYQIPVTVLSDKHLCESSATAKIDLNDVSEVEPRLEREKTENYKRYADTDDGVSPLKFPGKSNVVKNTSYEHLEDGLTTEKPEKVKKMQDKRLKKRQKIRADLSQEKCVNIYGESKDYAVITWGSTKGAVLEAKKILKNDFSIIQPIFMRPFPDKEVNDYLKEFKEIACVETNSIGQLKQLIEEKTSIKIDHSILKYDMRPFYPKELSKRLKEVFKFD